MDGVSIRLLEEQDFYAAPGKVWILGTSVISIAITRTNLSLRDRRPLFKVLVVARSMVSESSKEESDAEPEGIRTLFEPREPQLGRATRYYVNSDGWDGGLPMTGSSSGGGGQEQERGYISRRTLYVACFFSLLHCTIQYGGYDCPSFWAPPFRSHHQTDNRTPAIEYS